MGPFEPRLVAHKGYGLFATQDIPRGTRIIAEAPLISLPRESQKIDFLQQLKNLTPEQHTLYTELSCNRRLVEQDLEHALRLHLARQYQYSGIALEAAVKDMITMHAIFFTNAVTMGVGGMLGEGVFFEYARINHSCVPNVQNSFNANIGQITVHAVRDIAAGEELVAAYIPILRTKDQRQESLLQWDFLCCCEACRDEVAAFSEARRWQMFQIDQAFASYEAGYANTALFPNSIPENDTQALALAEELVGLLKEEGLVGIDLAHVYRACSKYSAKTQQMAKAMAYAKKELEVEIACIGDDTGDWSEGARQWMKSLEGMSEAEKLKMRMNDKRDAKAQKKADKKAAKKAGKGQR